MEGPRVPHGPAASAPTSSRRTFLWAGAGLVGTGLLGYLLYRWTRHSEEHPEWPQAEEEDQTPVWMDEGEFLSLSPQEQEQGRAEIGKAVWDAAGLTTEEAITLPAEEEPFAQMPAG